MVKSAVWIIESCVTIDIGSMGQWTQVVRSEEEEGEEESIYKSLTTGLSETFETRRLST